MLSLDWIYVLVTSSVGNLNRMCACAVDRFKLLLSPCPRPFYMRFDPCKQCLSTVNGRRGLHAVSEA
jgi:hypothetical protein